MPANSTEDFYYGMIVKSTKAGNGGNTQTERIRDMLNEPMCQSGNCLSDYNYDSTTVKCPENQMCTSVTPVQVAIDLHTEILWSMSFVEDTKRFNC